MSSGTGLMLLAQACSNVAVQGFVGEINEAVDGRAGQRAG